MSELNQTIGSPSVSVTCGTETFTLSPFAIEDYAAYELWLEENAWAAVHRANVQKWVTPDQHDRNIQNCIKLIAAEKLAYGSEAYRESSISLKGIAKAFQIATRRTHPDLSEKRIHQLVEEYAVEIATAIRQNDDVSQ